MPTRKQLNAKTTRLTMVILAGEPRGMHVGALWEKLLQEYPQLETDWAAYVNDQNGPNRNLRWVSSELVKIGWIFKDGNGTWQVTGVGRWALDSWPDQDKLWEVQRERYTEWRRQRAWFDRVQDALPALPGGAWASAQDLALVTGLDASLLVHHLCGTRPEGWHRVLDADGRPPEQAHLTEDERRLVEGLLEADGAVGADGRARPHQRLTESDLRQYLADDDPGETPKRRAWLVRGSSVHGENLVRSLWLPEGMCSLPASRLPEVPADSPREAVAAAVDDGYAHAGAAERDKLTREYHDFLTRMRTGDIVLTNDGAEVYIGLVDGPPGYTASSGGKANLQRKVAWHTADGPRDYTDLPEAAANRLTNPDAVLIDLTEFVGDLEEWLGEEPDQPVTERDFSLPDADPGLAEALLFDQEWLQECVDLLRDRPQLIFYGPPGTGKTYVAQELAKHLTGGKPENTQLVQFHPSYSYEDFFEGYRPRPAADGQQPSFELTPGPLRKLADAARKRPGEPFVMIIDEINRGNLAKVFGELYFLLEYRGKSVDLLYGSDDGLGFTLPRNIVILATMNTADRSIALIDAAMRRRFWFEELHPSAGPASVVLERWLSRRDLPDDAARLLAALNDRIADRDFRVGPSYLMREALHADSRGLQRVWRHQILPLLEEHHYGDGVDVEKMYGLATLRKELGLGEDAALA
ncbi:hypothetical protein GCM10023224_17510 [Streptomonospora halophila]|uniref:AAA+ ATPase domain-containing protein n=1 Tax=Streptomonospora halophila TaxID=427369 RepID=A0ABP9GFI6_9ACTN